MSSNKQARSLAATPWISLGATWGKMRRLELLGFLLLAVLPGLRSSPALCATPVELVTNGLLSQGHTGQPVGWQHIAYFSTPDVSKYSWQVSPLGVGALGIFNVRPNDSRWVQDFAVSGSTWYHVSGWIRTENVGSSAGAHLSVAENGYSSEDLRGTAAWRHVQFWMKTKPDQKSVELECRLGSFSALNTGTAYFTAISFSEGKPPPSAPGEQIFGGKVWDYPEKRRILVWLFSLMLTSGVALLLWRFIASTSGRIPP